MKWIDEAGKAIGSELANFIALSDDVVRLSLLTLVYRASPTPIGSSTAFAPQCIKTARMTLQRHQDCIAIIGNADSVFFPTYIHWYVISGA